MSHMEMTGFLWDSDALHGKVEKNRASECPADKMIIWSSSHGIVVNRFVAIASTVAFGPVKDADAAGGHRQEQSEIAWLPPALWFCFSWGTDENSTFLNNGCTKCRFKKIGESLEWKNSGRFDSWEEAARFRSLPCDRFAVHKTREDAREAASVGSAVSANIHV